MYCAILVEIRKWSETACRKDVYQVIVGEDDDDDDNDNDDDDDDYDYDEEQEEAGQQGGGELVFPL